MGKVRLKVLTVPALDPVTNKEHTAFSVVELMPGIPKRVPGWTLRDAINTFCQCYNVDRNQIRVFI